MQNELTKFKPYRSLEQRRRRCGFTLIEVVASLAVLAVLLTGIFTAYRKTVDSVTRQRLRQRGMAVAQRQMEILMANRQEPNSINLPTQDDFDPLFTWELDLERITVDSASAKTDGSNSVIQATVTVTSDMEEMESPLEIELVRYFPDLTPIEGHLIAVPVTPTYEDPEWYLELKEKLGREPTLPEIVKAALGEEGVEEMDLTEEDLEDMENIDEVVEEIEEIKEIEKEMQETEEDQEKGKTDYEPDYENMSSEELLELLMKLLRQKR